MQSRKHSFYEALTNQLIGYTVSVGIQQAVFVYYGAEATVVDSMGVVALFAFASIIRVYFIRRVFNAWTAHQRSNT